MFNGFVTLHWIVGGCFAVIIYLVYSNTQATSIAAFQASRLTPSTFLIKEYDDIYSEHPYIYAKIIPSANTILVVDTGCGGASNNAKVNVKSLRQFIESFKIEDNDGLPLNDRGAMDYVVVLTHCHYDHILGVVDFNDSPILASGHSPSFIDKAVLPEHSLCNALGIQTPQYLPTLVPHQYAITSSTIDKIPLGVSILHTPGHTPDEVALYDEAEMMLYVGDSLYEYEPIIFPREGSIVTWFSSVDYLISFVEEKNAAVPTSTRNSSTPMEVLINSGHRTTLRPALEVLVGARAFMEDVVAGREKAKRRGWGRGEEIVIYEQAGDRFSLRCPERLIEEARRELSDYASISHEL